MIGSISYQLLWPWSWSGDGKNLVLQEIVLNPLSMNICMLSMDDDAKRIPLLQEEYFEFYPKISPDGRWMAYSSNESGRMEVWIRPFPDVNKERWQVSTNGGDSPLWSSDGRELFYRNGDSVVAVAIESEPVFKAQKPSMLFI